MREKDGTLTENKTAEPLTHLNNIKSPLINVCSSGFGLLENGIMLNEGAPLKRYRQSVEHVPRSADSNLHDHITISHISDVNRSHIFLNQKNMFNQMDLTSNKISDFDKHDNNELESSVSHRRSINTDSAGISDSVQIAPITPSDVSVASKGIFNSIVDIKSFSNMINMKEDEDW